MKNRIINSVFIAFGILLCSYDFVMIALCPGTFLDNLFSFSHIWLIPGLYLIFLGVYRFKTKHSFWSTWKKRVKIIFVTLCSIGMLVSVVNLVFILTPETCPLSEEGEYLILLGGGIDKDGKLPDSVYRRVDKAAEYLKIHPETICVVTGGTLKWLPYAEAPEIKRQLVLAGISEEKVLVEDKALDTIQNFQLSCKLLAEHEKLTEAEILNSKIIVVTNNFHMRRAERLASRMGFTNIKGVSASIPLIKIPNSYVREICAYVKLNMRILLTGKPKKIV